MCVSVRVFFLTDYDECKDSELDKCNEKAKCTNTEGSYNCTCIDGYVGGWFYCQGMVAILLLIASLGVTIWGLLWWRGGGREPVVRVTKLSEP